MYCTYMTLTWAVYTYCTYILQSIEQRTPYIQHTRFSQPERTSQQPLSLGPSRSNTYVPCRTVSFSIDVHHTLALVYIQYMPTVRTEYIPAANGAYVQFSIIFTMNIYSSTTPLHYTTSHYSMYVYVYVLCSMYSVQYGYVCTWEIRVVLGILYSVLYYYPSCRSVDIASVIVS